MGHRDRDGIADAGFPLAMREHLDSMKARIIVTLKPGVLDPQGKAIEAALKSLGIHGIEAARQGKVFDLDVASADAASVEATLRTACEKLLANTVVETYAIEVG